MYRSCSTDPFENLAFEDWMYENVHLGGRRILFLWRNSPTVVIGRHQNPWKECNLELIKNSGTHLARRRSGGGTVYHDLGNINLTFFTDRASYNRRNNLEFVAEFLRNFYDFKVSVNGRDDLILDTSHKISGTAAKLGLKKAYHHCTLLCQVDLAMLGSSLISKSKGINSNATASVKSETRNLFDKKNPFCWNNFTDKFGNYFFEKFGTESKNKGYQIIDVRPLMGEHANCVKKTKNELANWNWVFGKTPKFNFEIEKEFSFSYIKLKMIINKGKVEDILYEVSNKDVKDFISVYLEAFIGQRFVRSDILAACTYQEVTNFNWPLANEISDWILSHLQH